MMVVLRDEQSRSNLSPQEVQRYYRLVNASFKWGTGAMAGAPEAMGEEDRAARERRSAYMN